MSIETEKKRLTEATIAQANATLKRAKDHVESQIAALDAAAAAEAAADAHA